MDDLRGCRVLHVAAIAIVGRRRLRRALAVPYGSVGNGKLGMTTRSIQPLMYLSVPTTRSAAMSPSGRLTIPLAPPFTLPPEPVYDVFRSVAASNWPSFGLIGDELDGAAHGSGAIQGALRAAQHFDVVEIEQVRIDDGAAVERHGGGGQRRLVDIKTHRRRRTAGGGQAAHLVFGLAGPAVRSETPGNRSREILEGGDVLDSAAARRSSADMLMGVSCTVDSRFSAVMTTSAKPLSSGSAPVPAAPAAAASACPDNDAITNNERTSRSLTMCDSPKDGINSLCARGAPGVPVVAGIAHRHFSNCMVVNYFAHEYHAARSAVNT